MNLILGQGIAGTVLALTLVRRGAIVMVIDDGHRSASSTVAAGLWNPIVFRRINKSWMADQVVSTLDAFYRSAEDLLNTRFYHPRPIWRIHSSDLENRLWAEKMDDPEFSSYLDRGVHREDPVFPASEFGSGIVHQAGYLDVETFLNKSRCYFQSLGLLHETHFCMPGNQDEFRDIQFNGKRVKRFIDCTGHRAASGKWFGYLPFALAKGEILTIRCPGLKLTEIFNAGFFILPVGDDTYRVGATFEWDNLDDIPTEKARTELVNKLQKWVKIPFEVVGHKAGVRPAVQDRRPLVGQHPEVPNLYCFNGMGTKGVMLAPLMASELVDNLLDGKGLSAEADIKRFSRYYMSGKTA